MFPSCPAPSVSFALFLRPAANVLHRNFGDVRFAEYENYLFTLGVFGVGPAS